MLNEEELLIDLLARHT